MRIFFKGLSISDYKGIVVYDNPTQIDVTTYCKKVPQIRGIIKGDNLYIWNAFDAIHEDMNKYLPGEYIMNLSIIEVNVKDNADQLWEEEGYIGRGPNFKVFISEITSDKKNHPSILKLIN